MVNIKYEVISKFNHSLEKKKKLVIFMIW